jgi:hypothetical protein
LIPSLQVSRGGHPSKHSNRREENIMLYPSYGFKRIGAQSGGESYPAPTSTSLVYSRGRYAVEKSVEDDPERVKYLRELAELRLRG